LTTVLHLTPLPNPAPKISSRLFLSNQSIRKGRLHSMRKQAHRLSWNLPKLHQPCRLQAHIHHHPSCSTTPTSNSSNHRPKTTQMG
jgi:hypothetical protein